MITPGIAASLTPKSVERRPRPEPVESVTRSEAAAPVATVPRRLRVPQVLLQLPHPHLPQRHA